MASLIRRSIAAVAFLSFVGLSMTGLARAATITVNTLGDPGVSGTCDLRDAIINANNKNQSGSTNCTAGIGTDTISFSVSGTITLGSTLPAVANVSPGSLTINGSGQAITVDGAFSFHILSVNPGATLNLDNLTIAHGFGGGFNGTILNNGALTVTNSTFVRNNAFGNGGGILNEGGTLTVTNSTFVLNDASGNGGGISNDAGGTLTVTNSTFVLNYASFDGGSIFNQGTADLKGTILAASLSGLNCAGAATPPVTDVGYNISDDGSCGFSGTSMNNSTTLNLDPAGLQNNGGPTQTIALEPNSQAVSFIPVPCTDQSGNPLTTDQRGFPRPGGNPSFCDAGAFELQTGRILVKPGTEQTQVALSTSGTADLVNMTFTFTDLGTPSLVVILADAPPALTCDSGTDALNGIEVNLYEGTCADLATATGGLLLDLSPFVFHAIGTDTFGTLFQSDPPQTLQQAGEQVSARIIPQLTPLDTCGEWMLNLEVSGLDTAALDLVSGNPYALVIEDGDKNEGCFDIGNAVVGDQTPPPAREVRRGVRR
jgi:hypothetical protein